MASLKEIQCADCGNPRLTRLKTTKYCLICRYVRNFKFIGKSTVSCIVCKNKFSPVKRGEDVCFNCDKVPSTGDPRGTCGLCDTKDSMLLTKDIAVCRSCAHDPEKRDLFRAALIAKQARLIDGTEKLEVNDVSALR